MYDLEGLDELDSDAIAFDCDADYSSDDLSYSKLALPTLAGAAFIYGFSVLSAYAHADTSLDLKNEKIDAFDPATIEDLKKEVAGKKLVLALISDYDEKNAGRLFSQLDDEILADFKDMPGYVVKICYTENTEDMLNYIRDYSIAIKAPSAAIMAYHGNPYSMTITEGESLTLSNVDNIFSGYGSFFSDDARIILYSCYSGQGSYNIALEISDALNLEVMAPKNSLVSESDVPEHLREGILNVDSSGKISFDVNKFFRTINPFDKSENPRFYNVPKTMQQVRDLIIFPDAPEGEDLFLLVKPGEQIELPDDATTIEV